MKPVALQQLRSAVAIALLFTVQAGAEDRKETRSPAREKGEVSRAEEKEKETLPRDAYDLDDENDVRYAFSETECHEGRILDYLERHGDFGYINPDILLETTRAMKEELERNRGRARDYSIGGSVWTSLGPTNGAGRVTAVATHPTTAGTAIVGAAGGGAWKTTTTGASWTALTETVANLSVGAIAYAPSDANVVYLGSGEGGYAIDFIPGIGLLASADGGTNWTLPASVLASMFYRINVHPTISNELIVGTNIGGLRSTAGQNGPWTTVITSASAAGVTGYGDVTDIVRDPTNSLILYAATWDRGKWCQHSACSNPTNFAAPTVLKSIDGGITWNPANSGLPVSSNTLAVNRISIAIAPSSTQTLYAATSIYDSTTGIELSHVYKTTNGGTSWTETSLSSNGSSQINSVLGAQAWYDNTIVVAPSDPSTVIVAGVYYAKTADGGSTWALPPFTGGGGVHVDAHDLRYNSDGTTLYIANDGGVWTSTSHGGNATNRNTSLVTRQFYGLTVDPVNRNRVFGGQQDNGSVFRPDAGGTSWTFFSGNDGFQTAINEAAPAVVFSTSQYGTVWRTKRAGDSPLNIFELTPPYPSTEAVPFYTIIKAHPVTPSTIYTGSFRLWRSTSGADAWAPLPITTNDATTWSTSSTLRSIAVSKSNPLVIMVAKSATVFRSIDGGTTWNRTISGLPSKVILHLEIDPTDANKAYAALAGQTGASVYYTLNGGTSWTARATGLPAFSAQVVRVDPTDSNTLYCGTDVGVYRSTDGGANWSAFGTGLPATSVYDLQAVQDGAILRAATHGRGIWELTVTGNTNTAPTATISSPVSTPQTVAVGGSLSFTGTFSDADGGDSVTATWTFPDTWATTAATSGAAISHTFNRAGRYPVTLVVTDSHGAKGAAQMDVIVTQAGETCASPIVIPPSGPFPYTLPLTNEESVRETATDPNPVGSCYGFTPVNSIWLSFTPASSGTYFVSACGSKASVVIAGTTGTCGTGSIGTPICFVNTSPSGDCAIDSTASFTGIAGQQMRLLVTSYFSNDVGPLTITINSANSFAPIVMNVSPSEGSTTGNTPITITGSGFVSGATVQVGGIAATGVTFVSSQLLTATSPAHAAGSVNLSVTNPAASTNTAANAFTYVSNAVSAPTNVVATAVSPVQVNVTWSAVPGADSYQVYRRSTFAGGYVAAGSPVAVASFSDTGRTPGASYLYKVQAIASGTPSPDSNIDLATTVIFTDSTLIAGTTTIKAVHLTELRTAVTAVCALANCGAFPVTDSNPAGVTIQAAHITQLRTPLDASRSTLGLSPISYANTPAFGVLVRAADFTELRNGTQ